jgi:hypothetical protein
MIPKNITEQHILRAIAEIDRSGVPSGRDSTKFLLSIKGKTYPPKYVVSLANKFANGQELSPSVFNGGAETNGFLKLLGFQILGARSEAPKQSNVTKPFPQLRTHDQRCSECKNILIELFRRLYGTIKIDHKIDIPARLQEYAQTPYYHQLTEVFKALEAFRGNSHFVRVNNLHRCDLFVVSPGFVVEFDESQHFTTPRRISLSRYPSDLRLGFDRTRWMALCEQINAKDNDPSDRDEARAWYDSLRDFFPIIGSGFKPTVRIQMGAFRWCSLHPDNPDDVKRFTDLTNLPAQLQTTQIQAHGASFRVGRTILDIGEPMSSLKSGSNMWHEHRRAISSYLVSDPSRYQARIRNILETAKANKVNVLLLPACTLLYRNSSELDFYRTIAAEIQWLATGMLKIVQGVQPKDYLETAEVWQAGQPVANIKFKDPHVEWLQIDFVSAYIAISSSIKYICSNEKVLLSKQYPPKQATNSFAFDLGHHQYNGRYKKVLNSVLRSIDKRDKYKAAVILSYWKYLNGNANFRWLAPESAPWIRFQRIELPTPDHALTDYLDVFDFAI